MKTFVPVFFGGLCFLPPQPIQAQCLTDSRPPKQSPLARLTVSVDEISELGKPLLAEFSLLNTSNRTLTVVRTTFVERDYEVHVFDSTGAELPLAPYGRGIRMKPIVDFRNYAEALEPGKAMTDSEDVSRVYSFSQPGEYSLVACRKTYETGPLSSNRVQFRLK